ncbi:hypothetical protein G9F71_026715 [Clostridium sp. FP2]|uniref:hypothetical protein n=1 Tax=Clostridium sp. FP2 TaxID=2724481 RepID=UPI0013E95D8B|nr:hypothetical protein [Clostridium sp. FP2]MBZ9626399.1 hypothetical protein [Clostridium sp. FP2]
MNKKSALFQISLVFLLIFSIFSGVNVRAYDNPTQNCDSDFWDNIYNVDEKKLVAEISNSNIKLYYVNDDKDFGMYEGFILQINGGKKYFRWENVNNNTTYAPQLTLADLDKDGKKEIIVQLCKGYGTGVYDGEVHVIRQEFFDEVLVENPIIILHKNKITLREFPEHFEVTLKHKKITINKKGRLTPPYSKIGIGCGNDNTRYEVKNNTLFAIVPLGIGVTSAGEFVVKYKFKDAILQMESIDFFD